MSLQPPPEPSSLGSAGQVPDRIGRAVAAIARHEAAVAAYHASVARYEAGRTERVVQRLEREAQRAERQAATMEREAARAARAELREAVRAYVRELKVREVPPQRVLVTVKTVLCEAMRSAPPLREASALTAEVVQWCIDDYYSAA